MAKKNTNKSDKKSTPLNQNWLLSNNKHIYVIKQLDQHGNPTTIGYARTRNEADLLIYDAGKKLFDERKEYRAQKENYTVTYSYHVDQDKTTFILHERSLGFLYNGHKIDRFGIVFEKVHRAYNRLYNMTELEDFNMESELHTSGHKEGEPATVAAGAGGDAGEAVDLEEDEESDISEEVNNGGKWF